MKKKEKIEEQETEKQEESRQEKAAARRRRVKSALLRNLAGVLAIVWMCIIFAFSAQTKEESGQVSQSVTYQMVSSTSIFFHLGLSEEQVKEIADAIEGFVRKAAHMTEYGILSVLLFIWIGQWEMGLLRRGATASGAAAVYAATDEIHQLFVPGRSGRFTDVCIDSMGAVLGIVVFVLVVKIVTTIRAIKVKREQRGQLKTPAAEPPQPEETVPEKSGAD